MATKIPADIIYTRENAVLSERRDQITLNRLAQQGGKPYISRRLWRAPNESELSWSGRRGTYQGAADDGTVGRKDRAAMINDCGRVSQKINQYLFSKPTTRDGIDPEFERDVTGTGRSVTDFWQDASEQLTSSQWCWIQIDRGAPKIDPVTGQPTQRTLAERVEDGDRVRWSLWEPAAVVDWCFDDAGRLIWLITSEQHTDASNPQAEPCTHERRRLWIADSGGAQWQVYEKDAKGVVSMTDYGSISSPAIPFVKLGTPSTDPWWFDDCELVQAQLLNLDSLHVESLVKAVFPQLVISEGQFDALSVKLEQQYQGAQGQQILALIKEVTRGLDAPLMESGPDSGITRFIAPDASSMSIIPTEIDRKRKLLFDMVGLALFNRETRQVQTVESKAFDHLDTETTLRHRAIVMQECEVRCVEMSKSIDTTFAEYDPQWPQDFGVIDPLANVQTIATMLNTPGCPLSVRKVAWKGNIAAIGEMTRVSDEDKQAMADDVEEMEDDAFDFPMPGDNDTPDNADADAKPAAPVDVVADTALNGAQVTSLVDVVSKVALRQLPSESAKPIIKSAFPTMDDGMIDSMINAAARFVVKPDATAQA